MTLDTNYRRVIPRDLFNESALLKMLGRLVILLGETPGHTARLDELDGGRFQIGQDPSDGSLGVANLRFTIGGRPCRLHRPLNTREAWSLYATDEEDEETDVFTIGGDFTGAFLQLIGAA